MAAIASSLFVSAAKIAAAYAASSKVLPAFREAVSYSVSASSSLVSCASNNVT
jgi:hypothetical protein